MMAKKNQLIFTIVGSLCLALCGLFAMDYFVPSTPADYPSTHHNIPTNHISHKQAAPSASKEEPLSVANNQLLPNKTSSNITIGIALCTIFIPIVWRIASKRQENLKADPGSQNNNKTLSIQPNGAVADKNLHQNSDHNAINESNHMSDELQQPIVVTSIISSNDNTHHINNVDDSSQNNGTNPAGDDALSEDDNNNQNNLPLPTHNAAQQQNSQQEDQKSLIPSIYSNGQHNHSSYYITSIIAMPLYSLYLMIIGSQRAQVKSNQPSRLVVHPSRLSPTKIQMCDITNMLILPTNSRVIMVKIGLRSYLMQISEDLPQISNNLLMSTFLSPQTITIWDVTDQVNSYNSALSMPNNDGLVVSLDPRSACMSSSFISFNEHIIPPLGPEQESPIGLLKQYIQNQLFAHTLFVVQCMISGKRAAVTPLDILICKKLVLSSNDLPLYMHCIWKEFCRRQQSITINMEHIYLDYPLFRLMLFSQQITNLSLFDTVAKIFPNVTKITCTNIDYIGGVPNHYADAVVVSNFIEGLKKNLSKIPKHTPLKEIVITNSNNQIKYNCNQAPKQLSNLGGPVEKNNKGIRLIKNASNAPSKVEAVSSPVHSKSSNVPPSAPKNKSRNDERKKDKNKKSKKKKSRFRAQVEKKIGSFRKSIFSNAKKIKNKITGEGKKEENKQLLQEVLQHNALNKKHKKQKVSDDQ